MDLVVAFLTPGDAATWQAARCSFLYRNLAVFYEGGVCDGATDYFVGCTDLAEAFQRDGFVDERVLREGALAGGLARFPRAQSTIQESTCSLYCVAEPLGMRRS